MQIRQAYQTCPKTKVIAAGYSQGGQIVHNAIGLLDAVTASWISKVVIFGDPGMHPARFPSKDKLMPAR
jgi:cutinase